MTENKLTQIPLQGIIKTIEGDLQVALYYNSNAIFAISTEDKLYHIRKVLSQLDKIRKTIEEIDGPASTSTNPVQST